MSESLAVIEHEEPTGAPDTLPATSTPVAPRPVDQLAAAKQALLAYSREADDQLPLPVRAAESGLGFVKRHRWLVLAGLASAGAALLIYPGSRRNIAKAALVGARGLVTGAVAAKVKDMV